MDKGNGIVILDTVDYYKKLDQIINDDSRFVKLDYNINQTTIKECSDAPWIKKEDSVARYCYRLIKPLVDTGTYNRIYPQGSQPGKLYGMVKNHKKNCPMRPVLSAINTPEYNLAKWLEKQLRPFLNDPYSVPSSEAFCNELRQVKPSPSDLYVSFDIKSLYTNVPVKEVVDDICNVVYSNSPVSRFFVDSKITKIMFRNILNICCKSIFLYKDTVYEQRDGVAMGLPLAPLLANWFVSKIERNIFSDSKNNQCKPIFYKRYVDDIFAVFTNSSDRDRFFTVLNSSHPNLQFTMEITTDALPFLDVEITAKDGMYNTRVYRKPTNTGVLLNFESIAPLKWKKALVRGMLNKAYKLSSSLACFKSETEIIKSSLRKNSYPDRFITKLCDNFIESNNIAKSSFPHVPAGTNTRSKDKKSNFFTIPYVGKASIKLQRQIAAEMERMQISVFGSYTTTKTSSYFNLKDKCPTLFTSNVVYEFTCLRDEGTAYIGETRRQLFRRVSDHAGKDKNSAVFNHLYNCSVCQSTKSICGQFKILQKCTPQNLLSFESLLIAKHRPVLNTQLGPGNRPAVTLTLYN